MKPSESDHKTEATPSTVSEAKPRPGFQRLWRATLFSFAGIKAAFRNEAAFREECYAMIVVIPLGLWLGKNGLERAVLVGFPLGILVIEILNSAIESVVDRFGSERHPLAGRAKDMGSAAVLVWLLICFLVWGLILLT
jgi:diacylglycerol kinase (ATP)